MRIVHFIINSVFISILTSCEVDKIPDNTNISSNLDTSNVADDHRQDKNLSKIISSKFPTALLFGPWTTDPNGPHADFDLNEESYFVVDHPGDGRVPYIISADTITLLSPEGNAQGIINKVTKDSLVITWDAEGKTEYIRWTR